MQTIKQKIEKMDLDLLHEEARRELLDFYEFLLNKYSINKEKCGSILLPYKMGHNQSLGNSRS